MQVTWVWSLVGELRSQIVVGQLSPKRWACTPQLESLVPHLERHLSAATKAPSAATKKNLNNRGKHRAGKRGPGCSWGWGSGSIPWAPHPRPRWESDVWTGIRRRWGTGLHTLRGQPALGPYGSGRRPGHQGDSKEVHVAGVLFSHQVMSNSFVTLWTVAHQAPLSMRFHRQEHWSGLPFPSPGDLPNPGIEPMSPARQVDSLPLSHQGSLARVWWGSSGE